MKTYIPDYPRPQLRRDNWVNLNGPWDFAFDDDDRGLQENWQYGFEPQYTIQVPFAYETAASGIGDSSEHRQVWYHRTFRLEDDSRRTLLHFEGSDWQTQVYINGKMVGSHHGGYARFSFDITHFLFPGENHLVVRVSDSLNRSQPRGKQRWRKENFACWYSPTTGIWKTVWLERAPASRIDMLKLTPCMSSASLQIDVKLLEAQSGDLCRAEAWFGGIQVGLAFASVKEGMVSFRLDLASQEVCTDDFLGWAPEHPYLYDLDVQLLRNGETIDQVSSYFGMRDITLQGGKILLNDTVYYQRLILDQGYWKDTGLTPPSEDAIQDEIRKIKAMGYNGIRKHQKIEDERYLYWCDRMGLLVWSEYPSAYLYNDDAIEWITREWMEVLRQNYNHPSIVTWVPFNESWGIPNVRTNKLQQHFTQAIYHLTKAFDPMRPVVCNDGWEHTVSDILTLHDYVERGEIFYRHYSQQRDSFLRGDIPFMSCGVRYAFAKGFQYQGQPILFSEFGGIAFDGDGWGYGNQVHDAQSFLERFDSIVTAIKKLDYCCGYCYTQVTDVEQEKNGLMDMERNFKVDPKALQEINLRCL